ncbi:MAG: FeoB-associated Cys-rich membrane protein [Dorea sp.]|nr:FeoB-associated Cys-rich membrane protein [Dorea sp.]
MGYNILATVLVGLVLTVFVILAVRNMWKHRKTDRCSLCSGCKRGECCNECASKSFSEEQKKSDF